MAKTLDKSGITDSSTIEAWHVTQSIDALKGTDAYDITISGSLNLTGSVTTGSFTGDGSGLTGITAEWDGTHNGDAQITGSLVVTQNITGSHISASGTGSFGSINLPDNGYINLGYPSNDLMIYHNGNHSYIHDGGTGGLILRGSKVSLKSANAQDFMIVADDGASVKLYYNNTQRLQTGYGGVDISGSITSSANISASGVLSSAGISSSGDIHIGDNNFIQMVTGGGRTGILADRIILNYGYANNPQPLMIMSGSGQVEVGHFGYKTGGGGGVALGVGATNGPGTNDLKVYGTSLFTSHITASGNISSSGNISGVSGSFSYVTGNSPLTIASDLLTIKGGVQNLKCCNVSHCITASIFSGSHQGDGSQLTNLPSDPISNSSPILGRYSPDSTQGNTTFVFNSIASFTFNLPRETGWTSDYYPIGTRFKVMNIGAGTTTIGREHSSVTFYRSGSAASTDFDIEQYEVTNIEKIAGTTTPTWICYP